MLFEDKGEKIRRIFIDNGSHNSALIRDVYRMQDRHLGDSAKLSEIIRKSEERNSRMALFNEFLGGNVLSQIVNAKIFPKYKKPLIAVSSNKIIGDKFKIVHKMWFDYAGNVESANDEEVQVSLDKFVSALVKGFIFIEDKETKKRFIFAIDFVDGWSTGFIAIYSNEKNRMEASTIIRDIVTDSVKNNFFKGAKITPNGKFIKPDSITMDDIILKDEIKKRISSGTIEMFNNIEAYKKNKVPLKRGILMEGQPGTGKTLVAKALCNQINSTFIWITADDIGFPEDISRVYDMARELSPTIVLFEDIDYIGKNRAGNGGMNGSYDKITGELLNQMDGVDSNEGIITLASSNYPKALDKALRNRPGRFDIRVRFDLPDADLRNKMVIKFFGNTNIDELDMEDIVKKTDGYTGAYIKELVLATIMLSLEDKSIGKDGNAIVKKSYFDNAFSQLEKSRGLDDVEPDD